MNRIDEKENIFADVSNLACAQFLLTTFSKIPHIKLSSFRVNFLKDLLIYNN